MVPRSIIALAALTILAVSACAAQTAQLPPSAPPGQPAHSAQLPVSYAHPGDLVKMTDVTFQDDEGHKLSLKFDPSGRVVDARGSKDGKRLDVQDFPLKGSFLCFGEPSKQHCAPIQFLSDGTLFKIGTGTCVCGYYGNIYKCVGYPTCP